MNTTILIKTFERPDALARLITSILDFYEDVPIVVVDDSRPEVQLAPPVPGIEYIATDFDIGVSAGKNLGMERVNTKYTFTCDDDCEFTEETKLELLEQLLEESHVDICGIKATGVDYCGRYQIVDTNAGKVVKMIRGPNSINHCEHGVVEGYDFVPNIFLAKTETLRAHPWDESLKMGEHFAHFYVNREKMRVGFTKDVSIIHGFPNEDAFYREHRARALDYVKQFMRKGGIVERIDLLGASVKV